MDDASRIIPALNASTATERQSLLMKIESTIADLVNDLAQNRPLRLPIRSRVQAGPGAIESSDTQRVSAFPGRSVSEANRFGTLDDSTPSTLNASAIWRY